MGGLLSNHRSEMQADEQLARPGSAPGRVIVNTAPASFRYGPGELSWYDGLGAFEDGKPQDERGIGELAGDPAE